MDERERGRDEGKKEEKKKEVGSSNAGPDEGVSVRVRHYSHSNAFK